MRHLGLSPFLLRANALWPLILSAGCSGETQALGPLRCDANADCASGFRCDKPIDRAVKGTIPCPGEIACTTAADCNAGEVCGPSWQIAPTRFGCQPLLCGAPCAADSCPEDATCNDAGVCELIPCDAPDGGACADHWRCDPEAARATMPDYPVGIATPEPDIARELGHGCVRIPCDEPDGYQCADLYACGTDAATDRPACLPESCLDTGRCLDDTFQVCITDTKHPDFTPDEHGCVTRGCDEGISCSAISARGVDVGYCDYSAPNADPLLGCAVHPCQSDADCGELQTCDAMGPFADGAGCRDLNCSEGLPCPSGWLCDLTMTADVTGCYEPSSIPSGGASGTGGASAGAPGATGGTGGGGTSGTGGSGSSRDGVCVRGG
jgi:hypothetical protein